MEFPNYVVMYHDGIATVTIGEKTELDADILAADLQAEGYAVAVFHHAYTSPLIMSAAEERFHERMDQGMNRRREAA